MKFPIALARVLASHRLWRKQRPGLVDFVTSSASKKDELQLLDGPGTEPPAGKSPSLPLHRCVSGPMKKPIVWFDETRPASFPRIGTLTREITASGRYVFLETDGSSLRRRIHMFRPSSRLYLTLKFWGLETVHDLRMQSRGSFGEYADGIRAAKLSGFLICALIPWSANSSLQEVANLLGFLRASDVDGFLILPALPAEANEISPTKLSQARKLIGNRGWEMLSQMMEIEVLATDPSLAHRPARHPANAPCNSKFPCTHYNPSLPTP
jgi:hypothetical protein